MTPATQLAYFADENALGLGKLLTRNGRTDIAYPGHPELPEVPLGTLDLDWMPAVSARRLIVLTRDRRIRTRPAELAAFREQGSVPSSSAESVTSGLTISSRCF